jgi:hypothetical protein
LKRFGYHLEIDETKREKYVSEADTWFRLIPYNRENIRNELAPVKSKNAWIRSEPYYIQVHNLNLITQRNYPLSCHFVKRPFAHQFREFYFFNPKAEELKWWTAKFLDHGLFEFWKRLDSHLKTIDERYLSLKMRSKKSNLSSTEAPDLQNFIGQFHLIEFYIVISVLTGICVGICLLDCTMQNTQELSLFVLTKFTHLSLQLLWTIVRFLYLMSRLIGLLYESRNPS